MEMILVKEIDKNNLSFEDIKLNIQMKMVLNFGMLESYNQFQTIKNGENLKM